MKTQIVLTIKDLGPLMKVDPRLANSKKPSERVYYVTSSLRSLKLRFKDKEFVCTEKELEGRLNSALRQFEVIQNL